MLTVTPTEAISTFRRNRPRGLRTRAAHGLLATTLLAGAGRASPFSPSTLPASAAAFAHPSRLLSNTAVWAPVACNDGDRFQKKWEGVFPTDDEQFPSRTGTTLRSSMRPTDPDVDDRIVSAKRRSSLSAATLSYDDLSPSAARARPLDALKNVGSSGLMSVLSAALLITGNTVGASITVLPDVAAGPGMGLSIVLFFGVFCINLLSGLLIAEVAIKQHESSGCQVPSSFKEFADVNLQSPIAGNAIASISVFVNACVLAFSLVRVGEVGNEVLGLDHIASSVGFAALIAGLVSTQTGERLSNLTSVAVAGLFLSFAGLLLPGLTCVSDPLGTILAPGTASSDSLAATVIQALPIIVSSCVYQNIVPSVTKLLNYDRTKTMSAIALGSFLPILMYVAWCYVSLGGGIADTAGGASGNPLFTSFCAASIAGSSVACVMSMAEEFDSILSGLGESCSLKHEDEKVLSIPSVLLAVVPALAAGLIFSGGQDFTAALGWAGGYGSPLLYGILPVILARTQRQEEIRKNLVPGGVASLGLLGAASAGFEFQEMASDFGGMVGSAIGAL